MALEAIIYGALSKGVNGPTMGFLNVIMALAVLTLLALLGLSVANNPPLVPHVCFLLFLAVGLWVLINWFVANLGLTDSEEQRREVLGDSNGDPGSKVLSEEQQGAGGGSKKTK